MDDQWTESADWMSDDIQDVNSVDSHFDVLRARSTPDMADITMAEVFSRQTQELQDAASSGGNFSSRKYDMFVFSLSPKQTGCKQRGVLPVPLAKGDTCLHGWYCPKSNQYNPPQACDPTPKCLVKRASGSTCEPQGTFEPIICGNGRYCPPGGDKQLMCPKGTFCPTGSVKPMKCSRGAICAAGSVRQLMIAPLITLVIIDLALLALVGVGFAISKWRKRHHKKYTTLDSGDGTADDVELLRAAAMPSRASISSPPPYGMEAPYAPEPEKTGSAHRRRASGKVDNMDGYVDDEATSMMDEDLDDDFHNSADFQRFIRSMTKTIETSSIGLNFEFENLGFQTKKGKKILQDVTGTIPRGSLMGIMGGSGAGKTTFVSTLMGKQKTTGGSIKVNGWEKDMSKYKKLIGYVPQDDIVFPELTVRENILHSARCRLPKRWRDKAIQDHVDSLIACLQLTHVQHSRVGDSRKPVISGGQRKRVNIGIELAAAPMAIFLDEPTSGLDATSASSVMRLLRGISKLGVTTIAIIHQPREQIFFAFDNLLVLANGQSVYSGPTREIQGYFESLGFAYPNRGNPADVLIDITTGDGAQYMVGAGKRDTDVQTLIDEWKTRGHHSNHGKHLSVASIDNTLGRKRSGSRSSIYSNHSTLEQEGALTMTMKNRGASWYSQVYYCFKRAMTQQIRNATSFAFEIGVGGLAGAVIGLSAYSSQGHLFQGIYHRPFTVLSPAVNYTSTPQLGLLSGLAIGLAASAPGFWVFGEEKLMYYRETAAGHSRSAYYLGKLLSTLFRIALSSFHFSVCLNILAVPLISFTNMYIVNLGYFWCIYGLASIVSMLVKREDGPLITVLASLVIGVLGGVAPPLSQVIKWHMEWFWRLSPAVWFTEAYFTENLTPLGYLYILELASEVTGFTLGQYMLDAIMLFVIGLVYRIIAYPLLIFVHRDKQR